MQTCEQVQEYRDDAIKLAAVPDLALFAPMYNHIADAIEQAGHTFKDHEIYLLCKDFPLVKVRKE